MNLFSTQKDQANQDAYARMYPLDPKSREAGFFEGIPTAAAMATGSVLNDFARPLSDAATPMLMPGAKKVDDLFKTDLQGFLLRDQQKTHDAAVNWTPDATTVGWLGRQFYGAGNVLGDVAVGTLLTGNPLAGVGAASGAQGYKGYNEAVDNGLDQSTALKMGAITGGSTFIGAFLPMHLTKGMALGLTGRAMSAEVAGNTATATALYGAANVAAVGSTNVLAKVGTAGAVQTLTGIPTRALTSSVLEANGYHDMAKQYEPFGMSEIISDFAIGSLFGLGAHGYQKYFGEGKIPDAKPSDLDAALALQNASHIELGTAPGIPADPAARSAHVKAVNKAIEQLLHGDPVHVGDEVTQQTFVPKEEVPAIRNVPDSVFASFPDMRPADSGLIHIENFTPEEQAALKAAGLVENGTLENGQTHQGVDPEKLWAERQLRAEKAKQTREKVTDEQFNEGVERRAQIYERLAKEQEDLGELGDQGKADEYRKKAAEIRAEKRKVNPLTTPETHAEMVTRVVQDHMGPEWDGLQQQLRERGLPDDTSLYSINGPREPLPPVRDRMPPEGVIETATPKTIEGAQARGDITTEEATLAKWLLENNPNIGKNLALLFKEGAGDQVGGAYNPLRRLATIFRGGSDSLTTVHEVLHHTERMMPQEVRDGIHAAWKAEVDALDRAAGETGNTDLMRAVSDIRKANIDEGTPRQIMEAKIAHENLINMVKDGLVSKDLYALVNRSEYWAVNASKLVRDRAQQGWVAKAVQWVKELLEKAKDAFGMRSDAPIIRALDAVLKSDGSLSGGMLSEGREFANVEAPGKGVAQENLNGFEPDLRVKVPIGRMKLPPKPLVLTGTNKKNAARQIAGIDEAMAKFPDADKSPLEWSKMMAYAMATDDVPVPPYRFLSDINSDGAFKGLSRLTPGQIEDANHGFENAMAFREAYTSKQLDVETTGKLFMWSFLSRGVSPYTQEGLFIDGFKGAGEWIKKAADGNLTEADFPAYEAWAKSVAPQGSGQPGSGATHNLNAFGKLFLFKMGQRDENGVSLLQKMHTMMEDPNVTGQQIRRWFTENTEGVGIDNKVVSFTLLVAGFKDLMVLDRVQIRQLWDDGRFGDRNLYDGRKVDGKPAAGSALSEITYGARGLLIYEAVERALAKRIENLYASLGRPEDASVGRYHWETWVADSQQEASHGTLDAILHDAQGNPDKISEVTAKEGEYGGYAYGARYGRDAAGTPYFMYGVRGGEEYRFTVPQFREFLAAVKSPANGVVPSKFKVTEAGNAPWYERPEVNKQTLDQLAKRYSSEPGAVEGAGAVRSDGEGQAVPDGSGKPGATDPYSAEALIQSNPALEVPQADGQPVPASRALAQADAEIASSKQDSQGYDAAVACALRG